MLNKCAAGGDAAHGRARHPWRVVAGVALVVNSLAVHLEAQPRWRVEAKPALIIDLGGNGSAVAAATRTPRGQVVIADVVSGLAAYDARGRLEWTSSKGRGAAMPTIAQWVSTCGQDSLFIWDAIAGRVVVADVAGVVVREIKMGTTPGQWAMRCSTSQNFAFQGLPRVTAEGRRLVTPGSPYLILPAEATVIVTDANGQQTGVLRAVNGGELVAGRLANGRPGGGPRPLGGTMCFAFVNNSLVVGEAASARIRIFDASGRMQNSFESRNDGDPVLPWQYARELDWELPQVLTASRNETRALFASLPLPKTAPAFTAIFSDPEGVLWRQVLSENSAVTLLRGVTRDGQGVADLLIPSAVRVMEVGADYVLGWTGTAYGAPRLLLYRFARTN